MKANFDAGRTAHRDHCAIPLYGRNGDAVMIGDMMHSPLQLRYPELATVSNSDPALGFQTRRNLPERELDSRSLVCSMRFPGRHSGRLSRWGEGYRFSED